MTTVPSSARQDVYGAITQKIVVAIEAGANAFIMPWHVTAGVGRPTNAVTTTPYQGVNVVALWAEAMMSGYGSGLWATYRQWSSAGAQVRRGEQGAVIVFYKRLGPKEPKADEEEGSPRVVAKASYVFNRDQVEGWNPPIPSDGQVRSVGRLEEFVQETGAMVRYGGERACYRPSEDLVEMPPPEAFIGTPTSTPTESFYATLLHELTHWTGAAHRLNRTFGVRFGDEAYAMEELVAELGAAFLCADLGIALDPRPDHAAYLAGWLKVLNRDPRAIFAAARQASEASKFLTALTSCAA